MKSDVSKSTPDTGDCLAENQTHESTSFDQSQTAITEIVVAFVDLGFGRSPTSMALRVANDNRPLRDIAQEFVDDKGASQ